MTLIQIEKKHSPEIIAEAAMCVWEHMLEERPQGERRVDDKWFTRMDALWDHYGAVEMRHKAYRIALIALEVYDLGRAEETCAPGHDFWEARDLIPYDWEFIPAVTRRADWSELYAETTADIERIYESLVALPIRV